MSETEGRLRSILVTGSSSGIGAAICRKLARRGVGLVVHGRENKEGANAVATECWKQGAQAMVEMGDLCEEETAAKLVQALDTKSATVVFESQAFPSEVAQRAVRVRAYLAVAGGRCHVLKVLHDAPPLDAGQ